MIQGKIVLNEAELQYLFRNAGYIPGITRLEPQTSAQQARSELDAEHSLTERGLLKRGFGGVQHLPEELTALLDICLQYEQAVSWDWNWSTGESAAQRYFRRRKEWLLISRQNEEWELSQSNPEQLLKELHIFPDVSGAQSKDLSVEMRKLHLKKLARLLRRGENASAMQVLAEYNLPKAGEELLMKGLQQQADQFSLILSERADEQIQLQAANLLISDGDCVEFYQRVAEDDRTMIGFYPVEQGEYSGLLKELLSWLTV